MEKITLVFVFIGLFFVSGYTKWENLPEIKVAVLDFSVKSTNIRISGPGFSDLLQSILKTSNTFIIVERSQLSNIIAMQKLDLSGFTEGNPSKVGRISGIDKIIIGSFSQIGKKIVLSIRAVDMVSGIVDYSDSFMADNPEDFIVLAPQMSGRIIGFAAGGKPVSDQGLMKKSNSDGLNFLKPDWTNVIAFYPMNGNAKDLSDRKNHGLNNKAVVTNSRFSDPGSSFFFGSNLSWISMTATNRSPVRFTLAVWFKASSGVCGRLAGFGDSYDWMSGNRDRQIYMHESGRLYCGIESKSGKKITVSSMDSYQDGLWHLAVMTYSHEALKLYMDGALTAEKGGVGESDVLMYNGFWRIGYDSLGGWPGEPSQYNFNGFIDDVLILDKVWTEDSIKGYFNLLGWTGQ